MPEVLERGDAFFLYRPKVEHEEVGSIDDVQRLFVILAPEGGGRLRRIYVGRKKLPPPGWAGRRHTWAYVDAVVRDGEELGEDAERDTYETKTRGRRVQPADRPVGEGVYALVREGEETHLVVELELPKEPGEAQEAINLAKRVSYVVTVKDPQAADRGQPRAPVRVELPDELQARFAGHRFIPVDPPELLDHAGMELLLMPVRRGDEPEVDLADEQEDVDSAELFAELGLDPGSFPTRPLTEGRWE